MHAMQVHGTCTKICQGSLATFLCRVSKNTKYFFILNSGSIRWGIFSSLPFFLWKYDVFWDIPCIFMSRSVGPWYSIGEKFFGHKIVQLAILFYGICSALHCLKGRVTRFGKFACTLFVFHKKRSKLFRCFLVTV